LQYVEHMMKYAGDSAGFKGKRVAISGSGNVAQYAALKAIELGGVVVSLSDSKGALVVEGSGGGGITAAQVEQIAALKVARKPLAELQGAAEIKYIEGARPWTHVGAVDVALPCATQNEVSGEEAAALVAAGARYIAEGSNMGATAAAIDVFEQQRRDKGARALWYAPGKAANAGGVAVSGLEMAQNSQRVSWSRAEVDGKLKAIMESCFHNCVDTAREYMPAKEGEFPSLVGGANIAGFVKVAQAMLAQGDWW